MIYLGSERIVTNSFNNHKTAEDYAGNHQSTIKMNGKGKVLKVVNRFESHEDSINYTDFMNNKDRWKEGDYYNCISITGKKVRMDDGELGGNQVWIETYQNNKKLIFLFAHLDSVAVKAGDIVDSNTEIGKQGNTGLVLSNKSKNDITYGSHVHLQVTDQNGNYISPRAYATGEIQTTYLDQKSGLDEKQNVILENKIPVTEVSNEESKVPQDTEEISDNKPSIPNKNAQEKELIFTCEREDYYYIKLYEGEKLYLEK